MHFCGLLLVSPLHKTTKMLKNFKAKVAGLMAQRDAIAAGKGWWRLEVQDETCAEFGEKIRV